MIDEVLTINIRRNVAKAIFDVISPNIRSEKVRVKLLKKEVKVKLSKVELRVKYERKK